MANLDVSLDQNQGGFKNFLWGAWVPRFRDQNLEGFSFRGIAFALKSKKVSGSSGELAFHFGDRIQSNFRLFWEFQLNFEVKTSWDFFGFFSDQDLSFLGQDPTVSKVEGRCRETKRERRGKS